MARSPTVVYDEAQKVWSAPAYPYWDFVSQSIGEAFLQQMRAISPDYVLQYFVDIDVEKTAGEIYRESVTIARKLQKLGLQKGDVVVLYSTGNIQTLPLVFGCVLIGVIVNFFDPHLSRTHSDVTLQLISPVLILYDDKYAQDIADSLERSPLPTLRHRISIDSTQTPNVESVLFHPAATDAELAAFKPVVIDDPQRETAAYMLTSGTTGPPKVVDLTHSLILHSVINGFNNTNTPPRLNPDMVLFSISVLRWISQVVFLFKAPLLGAKLICASGGPNGAYCRDIISKCGVTHMFAVPSVLQNILESVPVGDTNALSSLRIILVGGDSPSQAVRKLAKSLVKNGRVYCVYGMTELGGMVTNDELINGGNLSPGMQLQILDDARQPVGPGVRGQFYMKMVLPFKGYLKLDYSKHFSADGYFLNGDYGYMDAEGLLHVEGRYQDLIRGENVLIIPNKVENIVKELIEVSLVSLVGYKKSKNSSEDSAALFIRLKDSVETTEDAVRQKVRETLKEHLSGAECAVISGIHILQKFPLTGCGKIDREAFRNQAHEM